MCFLTTNVENAEILARLVVSSDEQPTRTRNLKERTLVFSTVIKPSAGCPAVV